MADETREESEAIDLASSVIGLHRSGEARLLETSAGPPRRIDGYTVGAPFMSREPPHGGEMHPDADELLFLVSGLVTVILEDRDTSCSRLVRPSSFRVGSGTGFGSKSLGCAKE